MTEEYTGSVGGGGGGFGGGSVGRGVASGGGAGGRGSTAVGLSASRLHRARAFGVDCVDCIVFGGGEWAPGKELVRKLVLRNVGERIQRIRWKLPRTKFFELAFPDPVRLAPGASVTLDVRFRPVRWEEYDDAIEITSESGTFPIPIIARLSRLQVDVSASLDFSQVPIHEVTTVPLRVSNIGQVEAQISLSIPQPFAVEPDVITLQPKTHKDVHVSVLPDEASDLAAKLNLSAVPASEEAAAAAVDGWKPQKLVCDVTAKPRYQHIVLDVPKAQHTTPPPAVCGAATHVLGTSSQPVLDFGQVLVGAQGPAVDPPAKAWDSVAIARGPGESVSAGVVASLGEGAGPRGGAVERVLEVVNPSPVRATVIVTRQPTEPFSTPQRTPHFLITPHRCVIPGRGGRAVFKVRYFPRIHGSFACERFFFQTPGGNTVELTCRAVARGPSVTLARKEVRATSSASSTSRLAPPTVSAFTLTNPFQTSTASPHAPSSSSTPAHVVTFGDVEVGNRATHVVRLVNHSSAPAKFEFVCASGGTFDVARPRGVIAPKLHVDVTLGFTARRVGNYARRLVVLVRDSDPVFVDALATAYDASRRPRPLKYKHLKRARLLPAQLRLAAPETVLKVAKIRGALARAALDRGLPQDDADKALSVLLVHATMSTSTPPIPEGELRLALGLARAAGVDMDQITETPFPFASPAFHAWEQELKLRQWNDWGQRTRGGERSRGAAATFVEVTRGLLPGADAAESVPEDRLAGASWSAGAPIALSTTLVDFGTHSRGRPSPVATILVRNKSATKLTISWMVPLTRAGAPSVRAGGVMIGSGSEVPSEFDGRGPVEGEDGWGRDFDVVPAVADIPAGGEIECVASFRPRAENAFYAAELELYAAPKSFRTFRLSDEESFVPPSLNVLQVLGNTLAMAAVGGYVPRIQCSLPPLRDDQHLRKDASLIVPFVGPIRSTTFHSTARSTLSPEDTMDDGLGAAGDTDSFVLDFPPVHVGDAAFAVFELSNLSAVPVAFQCSSDPSGNFALFPCAGLLPAEGSRLLVARFAGRGAGCWEHAFSVAVGGGNVTVLVRGYADTPRIQTFPSITPGEWNPGKSFFVRPTAVGAHARTQFRVHNPSLVPARFAFRVPSAFASQLSIEPPVGLLQANESAMLHFRFAPRDSGPVVLRALLDVFPAGGASAALTGDVPSGVHALNQGPLGPRERVTLALRDTTRAPTPTPTHPSSTPSLPRGEDGGDDDESGTPAIPAAPVLFPLSLPPSPPEASSLTIEPVFSAPAPPSLLLVPGMKRKGGKGGRRRQFLLEDGKEEEGGKGEEEKEEREEGEEEEEVDDDGLGAVIEPGILEAQPAGVGGDAWHDQGPLPVAAAATLRTTVLSEGAGGALVFSTPFVDLGTAHVGESTHTSLTITNTSSTPLRWSLSAIGRVLADAMSLEAECAAEAAASSSADGGKGAWSDADRDADEALELSTSSHSRWSDALPQALSRALNVFETPLEKAVQSDASGGRGGGGGGGGGGGDGESGVGRGFRRPVHPMVSDAPRRPSSIVWGEDDDGREGKRGEEESKGGDIASAASPVRRSSVSFAGGPAVSPDGSGSVRSGRGSSRGSRMGVSTVSELEDDFGSDDEMGAGPDIAMALRGGGSGPGKELVIGNGGWQHTAGEEDGGGRGEFEEEERGFEGEMFGELEDADGYDVEEDRRVKSMITFSPSSGVLAAHARTQVDVAFTAPCAGEFRFRVYYELLDGNGVDPSREAIVAAAVAAQHEREIAAERRARGDTRIPAEPAPNHDPLWCEVRVRGAEPSVVLSDVRVTRVPETLLQLFPRPRVDPTAETSAAPPTPIGGGGALAVVPESPVSSRPSRTGSERSGLGRRSAGTPRDAEVSEADGVVISGGMAAQRFADPRLAAATAAFYVGAARVGCPAAPLVVRAGGSAGGDWTFALDPTVWGPMPPSRFAGGAGVGLADGGSGVLQSDSQASMASVTTTSSSATASNALADAAAAVRDVAFFADTTVQTRAGRTGMEVPPPHPASRASSTDGSIARRSVDWSNIASSFGPIDAPRSDSLWEQLSLRRANRHLAMPLTSAEKTFLRKTPLFRNAALLPRVVMEFTPRPAGSAPEVLLFEVTNPTSLPARFTIALPTDADIPLEPWAEEAKLSRKEIAVQSLIKRRIIGIHPTEARLAPGQTITVRMHYAYADSETTVLAEGVTPGARKRASSSSSSSAASGSGGGGGGDGGGRAAKQSLSSPPTLRGTHEVEAVLGVERGKQLRLLLRGRTLRPSWPLLYAGLPTGLTRLEPVPIGALEAPTQYITLRNPSDTDLWWWCDDEAWEAAAKQGYGAPVLTSPRSHGVLLAGEEGRLPLVFAPVEAHDYRFPLRIFYTFASRTHPNAQPPKSSSSSSSSPSEEDAPTSIRPPRHPVVSSLTTPVPVPRPDGAAPTSPHALAAAQAPLALRTSSAAPGLDLPTHANFARQVEEGNGFCVWLSVAGRGYLPGRRGPAGEGEGVVGADVVDAIPAAVRPGLVSPAQAVGALPAESTIADVTSDAVARIAGTEVSSSVLQLVHWRPTESSTPSSSSSSSASVDGERKFVPHPMGGEADEMTQKAWDQLNGSKGSSDAAAQGATIRQPLPPPLNPIAHMQRVRALLGKILEGKADETLEVEEEEEVASEGRGGVGVEASVASTLPNMIAKDAPLAAPRPGQAPATYFGAVPPVRRNLRNVTRWTLDTHVRLSTEWLRYGDVPASSVAHRLLLVRNARPPVSKSIPPRPTGSSSPPSQPSSMGALDVWLDERSPAIVSGLVRVHPRAVRVPNGGTCALRITLAATATPQIVLESLVFGVSVPPEEMAWRTRVAQVDAARVARVASAKLAKSPPDAPHIPVAERMTEARRAMVEQRAEARASRQARRLRETARQLGSTSGSRRSSQTGSRGGVETTQIGPLAGRGAAPSAPPITHAVALPGAEPLPSNGVLATALGGVPNMWERTVLGLSAAAGALSGGAAALRRVPLDAAEARVALAVCAARVSAGVDVDDSVAGAAAQRGGSGSATPMGEVPMAAASSIGGKSRGSRPSMGSVAKSGFRDEFAVTIPCPPPPSTAVTVRIQARILPADAVTAAHGSTARAAFGFPSDTAGGASATAAHPKLRALEDARPLLPSAVEPSTVPGVADDILRAPTDPSSTRGVLGTLLQELLADAVAAPETQAAMEAERSRKASQAPITFAEIVSAHKKSAASTSTSSTSSSSSTPSTEEEDGPRARAWSLRSHDLREWMPRFLENTLLNLVREAVLSDADHPAQALAFPQPHQIYRLPGVRKGD